jgi:hypothetical protein
MPADFEPERVFITPTVIVTSADVPEVEEVPLHFFLRGFFRHREKLLSGLAGDVKDNKHGRNKK